MLASLSVRQVRPVRPARPRAAVASARAARSEFPRFAVVLDALEAAGVESVTAERAEELIERDWILVDVRPKTGRPYTVIGAAEVPIFEAVDMRAFRSLPARTKLKAVAHVLNGVTPMELNANFAAQVLAAAEGRGVILMCEDGGSMDRAGPRASRSIKAAWKLLDAAPGHPTAHMKGGTAAWAEQC